MGTISITTPSDGQTIDASDVATPLNTIVSEINGSLDSNNIAAGGVVPNNLTSGTGTSWAWQSWTPTWTGLSVGNGTVSYSKYIQIGKSVHFRLRLVFGSTTSISGDVSITLPVTAASDYASNNTEPIGVVNLSDTGSQVYDAQISIKDTDELLIRAKGAGGTYVTAATVLSSTVPFTWTTNDRIELSGTYEAA